VWPGTVAPAALLSARAWASFSPADPVCIGWVWWVFGCCEAGALCGAAGLSSTVKAVASTRRVCSCPGFGSSSGGVVPFCGPTHRKSCQRIAEAMGEATVPTKQPSSGQAPRVPPPDVDPGRTDDPGPPAREGPQLALGLTPSRGLGLWRVRGRAAHRALSRAPAARCGRLMVSYLAVGGEAVRGETVRRERGARARVALCVSVPRRVVSAVARNRLRRRLRGAAASVGLPPGQWRVVVLPGAGDASAAELREWLTEAARVVPGVPGVRVPGG